MTGHWPNTWPNTWPNRAAEGTRPLRPEVGRMMAELAEWSPSHARRGRSSGDQVAEYVAEQKAPATARIRSAKTEPI